MPTFPADYDLARPVPNAPSGILNLPTAPAAPQDTGVAAQSLADAGAQVQKVAGKIDDYSVHLETVFAQNALNTLRKERGEMTYGDGGFQRLMGGDAINPEKRVMETYSGRFNAAKDRLMAGLSPLARRLFEAKAGEEETSFRGEILKHQMQQATVYDKAVLADTISTNQNELVRNINDPKKVSEIVGRIENAARNYAMRNGLPADGAAAGAKSDALRIVTENLLAQNKGREAIQFFDANKSGFDAKDLNTIEAKLKSTANDIEGDNLVAAAFGLKVPDAVKQYDPLIQKAATASGVRPALVAGVMSQESQGVRTAVSPAGAGGLMQIMPGTAKDLGVSDVFDPSQSIPGGANYLKQMLGRYNGNERLALMAYNWGRGNVDNWIKTGSDPEKIPFETREYVQKVQGYATGYGGKADAAAFKLDLINRTDIPPSVKANAFAKIEKLTTASEALRTASLKTLNDQVKATFATALFNPEVLTGDTFARIADQYSALGEASESVRYRALASMEGTLKQGLQSATDAQLALINKLAEGLPGQVVEAYITGNTKRRSEMSSLGAEKFAQIKQSVTDGIKPTGLINLAKEAMTHYSEAGKPEEARKISDYMTAALNADAVASGNPAASSQVISDLTAHANKGEATALQLETVHLAKTLFDKQQGLLKEDALKNGATIYAKDVGQLPALDPQDMPGSLAKRADVARKIEQLSSQPASVLTNEEATMWRNKLDEGNPQQQAQILRSLSASPPDMIPRVAAQLAGKGDASDATGRGYAAALSFYSKPDAESQRTADLILDGTQRRKEMGDSGRKLVASSDAVQSAVQEKIGNAFIDRGKKVPAIVVNAAEAVYTSLMARAGRQGEKVDTDILNQALDAVVGKTITLNGQMLLPPKGVGEYQFRNAVRSLSDGDFADMKTLNGTPITAEKVVRYGSFTNAGAEGLYFVQMPDPANGGEPGYVMDPRRINPQTGQPDAYVLDIRPLLERAQRFPGYAIETPNSAATARRQAPASPTEGVQP